MSEFESTRAHLSGMFQTGWGSYCPVEWPNRKFNGSTAALWARFAIVEGARETASVGKELIRTPGMVAVQLFDQEDQGTRRILEAAELVAGIFDFKEEVIQASPLIKLELRATQLSAPQLDGSTYRVTASTVWIRDAYRV